MTDGYVCKKVLVIQGGLDNPFNFANNVYIILHTEGGTGLPKPSRILMHVTDGKLIKYHIYIS